MFESVKAICEEFDLDYTEDVNEILKKLTEIQISLHPDNNPDYDSNCKEKYNRVTEAKSFIRKNYQNSITVSEMMQLIKIMNKPEITTVSKQAEQRFENTYKEKCTQIKHSFLPKKIALGTIMAVVSFIWAFPSTLASNPIIEGYINDSDYERFFFILTCIWLFVLFISLVVLLFVFKREMQYKNILNSFKNIDFQYDVFSSFIQFKLNQKDANKESPLSFNQKEVEDYVLRKVLYGNFAANHYRTSSYVNSNKHLRSYVADLLPQISDIIISKAIEHRLIEKSNTLSWYDEYIVVDVNVFNDNRKSRRFYEMF